MNVEWRVVWLAERPVLSNAEVESNVEEVDSLKVRLDCDSQSVGSEQLNDVLVHSLQFRTRHTFCDAQPIIPVQPDLNMLECFAHFMQQE